MDAPMVAANHEARSKGVLPSAIQSSLLEASNKMAASADNGRMSRSTKTNHPEAGR